MLRVDPKQRNRLVEIFRSLDERITEARMNDWLGEVQGLQTSLDAAAKKLVALDRTHHPAQSRHRRPGQPWHPDHHPAAMIGTAGMPDTPDDDSEMLVNQLDASTGWPKLFSAASQRTHGGLEGRPPHEESGSCSR